MFTLQSHSPSSPPWHGVFGQPVASPECFCFCHQGWVTQDWKHCGWRTTWRHGVSASGTTACRKQGACCYEAHTTSTPSFSYQLSVQVSSQLCFTYLAGGFKVLLFIITPSLFPAVFFLILLLSLLFFLNRSNDWLSLTLSLSLLLASLISAKSIINDLRGLAVTSSLLSLSRGYWGESGNAPGPDTDAGLQKNNEAEGTLVLYCRALFFVCGQTSYPD